MRNLPDYPFEPDTNMGTGWLHQSIARNKPQPDGCTLRLRFAVSYQGEVDYECVIPGLRGERYTFRWAKVPWRWSWLGANESYWNYPSEAEFELSGPNAAWGILHRGSEAVCPEILQMFREEYVALAVTGFFNHVTRTWEVCEATTERRSEKTWFMSPAYARFCLDHPTCAKSLGAQKAQLLAA